MQLQKQLHSKAVAAPYHMGFALYDLEMHQMLAEFQSDKGFLPASNIKLYTFYVSLASLGDSLPTFKYIERNDSLIVWGCGDPSFLHPECENKAFDFLKKSSKKIFIAQNEPLPNFWGRGWQWDDFGDYYQAEISDFPIYSNRVIFTENAQKGLNVQPRWFAPLCKTVSATEESFQIKRVFESNTFLIPQQRVPKDYKQEVPFKTSVTLTAQLLADTLHKKVDAIAYIMPDSARTYYGTSTWPLYKKMLVESDNLVAEQLLWEVKKLTKNVRIAKTYMGHLPTALKWVDASGLSRLNLTSPANNVALLDSIMIKKGNKDWVLSLFPIGGKSGTIKGMYTSIPDKVYAKTGSMLGVYNQSGYIKTKSGRLLAFSVMNNHFQVPPIEVKKEVEQLMTWVYDHY